METLFQLYVLKRMVIFKSNYQGGKDEYYDTGNTVSSVFATLSMQFQMLGSCFFFGQRYIVKNFHLLKMSLFYHFHLVSSLPPPPHTHTLPTYIVLGFFHRFTTLSFSLIFSLGMLLVDGVNFSLILNFGNDARHIIIT